MLRRSEKDVGESEKEKGFPLFTFSLLRPTFDSNIIYLDMRFLFARRDLEKGRTLSRTLP